jgi:hypothetical protein
MPVQAIIEHGARPAYDLEDETGVLVTKLSIKPTREYVERKNSQRMVSYIRAENPRITFEFTGIIVGESASGFADQHPGTAITTLANFQSSIHGFSPTEGKIIFKDPSRELSDSEDPQVSFTAEMYPGIAAS